MRPIPILLAALAGSGQLAAAEASPPRGPELRISAGDGTARVSFRAESAWSLEASGDLVHWSTDAIGEAGAHCVSLPTDSGRAFFRLRLDRASCHPADDRDD